MNIARISIDKVKPGMIAAVDVVSCGKLVVGINEILTDNIIQTLKDNGFTSVPVKAKKPSSYINEGSDIDKNIINVKNPISIEEISLDFQKQVDDFKSQLNALLKGHKEIDVDNLLNNIKNITDKVQNPFELIEVMDKMKKFDDSTYVHSLNVALVGMVLAEWVNLLAEDIKKVALAGLLHDIGKMLIPKRILNKPGKLTELEFEIMKQHSLLGYTLVKNLDIPMEVKLAVLQHHEKCDGSGYPYGLKREEINDISKIITIADIYDAMTSARCYREPICPLEVMQILEVEGVKKYEPKFLFPFFKGIVQNYIHKTVESSNGEIGEVVMIHKHDIARPLIKNK